MTQLFVSKLLFSTIRVYLYGVRSAHVDAGVTCTIANSKTVERLFRGIKRTQGVADSTRPRFPIAFAVLRKLDEFLNRTNPAHRLLRAVIWTATAGLFRIGEIVGDTNKLADQSRVLLVRHYSQLQLNPPAIAIHLRASKTDIFRKEVDVKIGNRTAIAALQSYLHNRKHPLSPNEPLFCDESGVPITRKRVLTGVTQLLTAAGFDTSKYSGISFRRGGATSLSAAGVPDRIVKIIGRWRGWSYARYIETPLRQIVEASSDL